MHKLHRQDFFRFQISNLQNIWISALAPITKFKFTVKFLLCVSKFVSFHKIKIEFCHDSRYIDKLAIISRKVDLYLLIVQ